MIVRSGQDEIGRRSWAGSCVKYLQHKAVIARSTLHVTFGQVGATVAGTNSQITNPLRIWRFNRGWAVGRAHADAVLASSVILAAHLFTQIAIAFRSYDDELLITTGGQLQLALVTIRDAVCTADFSVSQLAASFGTDAFGSTQFVRFTCGVEVASLLVASICFFRVINQIAKAFVYDGETLIVAARLVTKTARICVSNTIRAANGIPFTAAWRTVTTRLT